MLTFVSTCWAGARPIYEPWHIVNLDRMLRKHVDLEFRHTCVTDQVDEMRAAGVEAVPLWQPDPACVPPQSTRHYLNNWLRLGFFNYDLTSSVFGYGTADDTIVSIDADIVIRRDITHLFRTLHPFKILSFKGRCHLQGGLIMVQPGRVSPDPWTVLHTDPETVTRSRRWGGSDQALLSELFWERVRAGEIPTWNEDDGIAINALHDCMDWSLFFRTGHRKCWDVRMPEAREYYAQSGRDFELDARPNDPLPEIVDPRFRGMGKRRSGAIMGDGLRRFRVRQIEKKPRK